MRENFSMRTECMWSLVNLIKQSPKICDLTKSDVCVLDLSHIHGKVAWEHGSADFSSVFDLLTRWFQKGFLKQELSGIQETTFFAVNNFRNI